MTQVWHQSYLLWGQGLGISALIAALPTLLLLFLLAVKRRPAWQAALAGLAATLLLAIGGYGMSFRHTFSSAAYGAAFGLFPINWIVFSAILLYRITVATGKFEIIKASIGSITTDMRLQILLVAFAFGAFLEGGAGFGTPVAVAAAMMAGLGFSPFYASSICLLANTAPVAFGAIGTPVITLAAITSLPVDKLSADVGRICAPISFLIPAYLIAVVGGVSGMKEVWPALLVCGATFAGVQFFVSNFIGAQLTDILSSLSAIVALVVLLRFWHPKRILTAREASGADTPAQAAATAAAPALHYTPGQIFVAWMPYLLLVVFVLAWGYKPVQQILNTVSLAFPWPWLHNEIHRMPPVLPKAAAYGAVYSFNWLSAAGTSCMLGRAVVRAFSPHEAGRLLASAGLRGAPTLSPHHHGNGCARHGLRYELLWSHWNSRSRLCRHRCRLPVLQRAARLAGRLPHRFRHFRQRALRQSASGDRR